MDLLDMILILLLIVCVITDIRSRKIYNKVLFPTFLLALTLHLVQSGLPGFSNSILGLLTGLGLLLIPYLMGGMGAGDVKLLAVIGAIKGVGFVLVSALYMALVGGVLALCILLFRRGVTSRLRGIIYWLWGWKNGAKLSLGINKDDYKATYPYGVAIAIGTLISFGLDGEIFL
ncbi:A24 family peptidase [Thalassobacillus hwangdonensis]|uniref:Prepilin peptidase n=1 Tax=Thalassobacillus hwangdonensis TaxID=546108 RepID=A0ABW3L373_9BACI